MKHNCRVFPAAKRKNDLVELIEYDSDTGSGDEGFWDWWTVANGKRSFRCFTEEDANYLCDLLNNLEE